MKPKLKWLKYDLHMHSYNSLSAKKSEHSRLKDMSAKEFVEIVSAKTDVFSVTDHNYFSAKYYSELREEINDKPLALIDGVELDVYVDADNFFQLLVYFEKNNKNEEIESTISDLYKGNNKPKLSDIITNLLSLNLKFILIPEGNKSRGITKILEFITPEFYDEITKYAMYKIFSGYDITENFNKSSQEMWAANYYKDSTAFNELTKEFTDLQIAEVVGIIDKKTRDNSIELPANIQTIYDYILKYSNYFAYFTFSDWHNGEDYSPLVNNFVFGSIDNAFESLEIAVLDPQSRIIRSKEREILIPDSIIKNITFTMNNVVHNLSLSPGLNVIIGKRGSGKSLLTAIITKLTNSDDEQLSRYQKQYNVKDISGQDYGGIDILEGGLQSLAILAQSDIKTIYDDPNKAWKTISSKFPKIKELDMNLLTTIHESLLSITPINKDLKSVTSNLTQLKKSNTYIYNKKDALDYIGLRNTLNDMQINLDQTVRKIKEVGFKTIELEQQLEAITSMLIEYMTKVKEFNKIISNHNLRIDKLETSKSSLEKTNRLNRNELKNAINLIKSNFKQMLNYKTVEHLINTFKFDVLPVETHREGKYLFVTYYKIPENLKDTVLDKITATIKKNNKVTDLQRLKNYILGETALLSNKTLSEEYTKFLKTDIFESKRDFYQINISNFEEDKIKNNADIAHSETSKEITNLNEASLGTKSVAYLDMLFDSEEAILLLDQPEDNIDNDYISNFLVPIIKSKKREKQLIFVTHNPSVAVYGDAFNYIYSFNENGNIIYKNYFIESKEDKDKILNILDGGKPSFSNRNKKYGNILGEEEYETNN